MANNIVVFDSGRLRLMHMLIESGFPALNGNVTFHLFTNSITLTHQRELADLNEMTMLGYLPRVLSGALDEGLDENDSDTWRWPDVFATSTITPIVPVIAFGYYVTHNVDGTLLWGQLFDVPAVWSVAGDRYAFAAQLSLGSCCDVTPPTAFALFAVDGLLRSTTSHTFDLDAVLQVIPTAAFEVDAVLGTPGALTFQVDTLLARRFTTGCSFDALLATRGIETLAADAYLWEIPPHAFFVDSSLVDTVSSFFLVSSVLANRSSATFAVDAVIDVEVAGTFGVDAVVMATPGVIIIDAGFGSIHGPPGIYTWNAFIWGRGGRGGNGLFNTGGGGGGGGGFAQRWNIPIHPTGAYDYAVDPTYTDFGYLTTEGPAIWATFGSAATSDGPGGGGFGAGGDDNYVGGNGGHWLVGGVPHFGAGGGAGAGPTGDGEDGQDEGTDSPGLGGNYFGTFSRGGAGANPSGGGLVGQDGGSRGGGGGGNGWVVDPDPLHFSAPGNGCLVITWQAALFWLDAVIKNSGSHTFGVNAMLAGEHTTTFGVDTLVASRGAPSFTVDGLLAAAHTQTCSIDADLRGTISKTFLLDTLLASLRSRTFTVDAIAKMTLARSFMADSLLASRFTKTFSADSLLASRFTKTFTVTSLLASRFTKTFTVTSLLASRFTKTFTVDSNLTNLYLYDLFNDPDTTLLSAHTMNLGPGWTLNMFSGSAGNIKIFNNAVGINTLSETNYIATANGGTANRTCEIQFQYPSAVGGQCYVASRWASTTDYFEAVAATYSVASGGGLGLYGTVSGVVQALYTPFLAVPTLTAGVIYTLTLYTTATTVRAVLSGPGITTVDTGAIANSNGAARTVYGMGGRRNQAAGLFDCTIENFRVF